MPFYSHDIYVDSTHEKEQKKIEWHFLCFQREVSHQRVRLIEVNECTF